MQSWNGTNISCVNVGGTVLWHGVVALFVIELVSKPQPLSSLMRRSNYHQWTKSIPWAVFEDYSTKFHWTSCKSTGHGPLTKGAMGLSWSLTGQLNTNVLFCRLRVVDKMHEGPYRGMAHVIRPGLGPELDLPIWMSYLQHGPRRNWAVQPCLAAQAAAG